MMSQSNQYIATLTINDYNQPSWNSGKSLLKAIVVEALHNLRGKLWDYDMNTHSYTGWNKKQWRKLKEERQISPTSLTSDMYSECLGREVDNGMVAQKRLH